MPDLNGGNSIDIEDIWLLNQVSPITLDRAMKEFNSLKIDFIKTTTIAGPVQITQKNGVFLIFDCPEDQLEGNQNDYELYAFGLE